LYKEDVRDDADRCNPAEHDFLVAPKGHPGVVKRFAESR
jgi:hypothetical protein